MTTTKLTVSNPGRRTAPWLTVTDENGRTWPVPAGGSDDGDSDHGDDADDQLADDDAETLRRKLAETVANSRKWEKRAKDNQDAAQRLQEIEDAGKSQAERLAQQLAEAQSRASEAEAARLRLEVAMSKAPDGMPLEQVRSFAARLRGSDVDELGSDADELFSHFTPPSSETPQPSVPTGLPTPKLTPGSGGGDLQLGSDPLLSDLQTKLGIRS